MADVQDSGFQALVRDGFPYPLRADDKPRAVYPAGLSMQEEMQSIAGAIKARHAAKQAAQPVPPTAEPKTRAQLLAELREAEAGFDPAYQYSDDFTFWTEQRDKEVRIRSLVTQLAQVPL